MQKRYEYIERVGGIELPIIVTRGEMNRLFGLPGRSQEENDKIIDKYLEDKGAVVCYNARLNEYQESTRLTAIYPKDQAITYLALGLASEAGEVAGKIKKVIRDQSAFDLSTEWKKDFLSEVGDVLWYIARIADELDVSLSEVAEKNIEKLLDRSSRGVIKGSGDSR